MKSTYVSEWDGCVEVRSSCDYNPETRFVSNIETSDVDGLEVLEKEYIVLPDDTEIKVLDFGTFQELWEEQETNSVDEDDKDQLIEEIDNTDDFDELFTVIRSWATKPDERITDFLTRNGGCVCVE